MTETWKQCKVYIASGYFDMPGERRELHEKILPAISKKCVPLRIKVSFVDIRVGLSEEMFWTLVDREGMMPILTEIDRCAPFFLGLYGEKYGKRIQEYKFPKDPQWNKIRTAFPKGRSLLELETYWGALREPTKRNALFYFRDPAFMMSRDFIEHTPQFCAAETQHPLVTRYPEKKTDPTIGQTYMVEDARGKQLMAELKAKILQIYLGNPLVVMAKYPSKYIGPVDQVPMVGGLEDFSKHVSSNLFDQIIKVFPSANLAVDLIEAELSYHKAALDQQLELRFVGRKAEQAAVMAYCTDPSDDGDDKYLSAPLIVHGRPGAGVTCLMSNVLDFYRDQPNLRNDLVIYHIVKSSPSSSNARFLLHRLCSTIAKRFDFNFVIPYDFPSLTKCFHMLIEHARKVRGNRICIFIDGCDQIDAVYHGDMMHWIPYNSYARIILSMHTGSGSFIAITRRYEGALLRQEPELKELELPELVVAACKEILAERMFKANKSLSVRQTTMLLNKAEGRRPLYLLLAATELMNMGKDLEVFSLAEGLDNFVYQMAPTTIALCRQTFQRWADDFPQALYGNMVQDILCLLATARRGLHEDELAGIATQRDPRTEGAGMKHAPIPLPPLMLAHILSRLRVFLMATPRHAVSSVQFQQWAMLRSIQKYYFPDNFASSQLWIKIHTFVMARDLSGKVNKAGAAAGLNLVSEAMKNSTTRNAEEVFHSRLARFFKEREMASMNPRALWSGRYPRALSELAYHMSLSRSWSQLEELLLDLRFIEGKFRQRLGHDLLQDFVLAVQAKAPEAAKWGKWGDAHKRIQDVHRFIAQNFELLQTDSSQCFQLAANHADSSSLAGIALHHWQTGRVRQVWSRWLNKPVEVDPQILVMYGHTAPITRVRFSSDGLRIISGSLDASVRVWDAFSGEIIATVRAHLLPVLAVGFIPGHSAQDERGAVNSADWRAISASRDKTLKLWDLQSGQELRRYKGHIGRVLCLAIAQWTEYEEGTGDPIQKTYVATGSWDRSCKIWDLDSGSLLHELGGKPDRNTCPNSEGHENAVTDCCFSPDGSVLATGSDDETLRLWNLFTGEEIKVLEGHDNGITSVDYAANGEYILTASLDATLKLWDVSSESGGTRSYFDKKLNTWVNVRVEMATFIGNQDAVYEGRISRDLQTVVSGSKDGTVRIYNAIISSGMMAERKQGKELEIIPKITLHGHAGAVKTVSISGDSWRVASAGEDGSIRVWDLGGTGTPSKSGHMRDVTGVSYGPFGDIVVSCGKEGALKIWDPRDGLFIRNICQRDEQLLGCCVSPDGLRVALACDDGVLRAYDVDRPDAVITQRHSFAPFSAVTYAPSGLSIATGSDDGTVKMWDASNGDMKAHFLAHIRPADEGRRQPKKAFPVHALCYDKSSTKLVSCSADGTLKYWLRMVKEEGGMMGLVNTAEAEDEATSLEKREIKRKRLTSQMMTHRTEEMPIDDRIARQKRKDRERKKTLASRQERYDAGEDPDNFTDDSEDSLLTEEDLHQIAFDLEEEDGDLLQQSASATPQDWKLVCTLKGHSMPVLDAKFNHAANVVFSCSRDGTVRAWQADFGHEESIRVLLDNHEDNEHDAGFDRGTMPYRAHDAGFGGVCEGLIHNNCLVIIDLRSGPVRSLCVTGDDAILVAVADGLRREDGGLISYWDARAYCRVGSMITHSPAFVCATAGDAPYLVAAGDEEGQLYLCKFGAVAPAIPKPARKVDPPDRPSKSCTIL